MPEQSLQEPKSQTLHSASLEKAAHAFAGHKLVRIRKTNGQISEPAYIAIMYGDVAFRMQPRQLSHESEFIRMADIQEILFED